MVLAMGDMKAAPLGRREWAENWVICNWRMQIELGFALADDFIHAGQVAKDFPHNFRQRRAPRECPIWGLAAAREIAQARHQKTRKAVLSTIANRARLTGG